MKRIITYGILLVSVIQTSTLDTGAQLMDDPEILHSPIFRERFHLFADRTLYATGEKVYFRLYNLSPPLLKENGWSRVIYLELINNRNVAVAQGKYPFNETGGEGVIGIPDTVSTGWYWMRAYTRWMRNFPPDEYCYLPLIIINPGKMRMAVLASGREDPAPESGIGNHETGISCKTDKTSYGKREQVTVLLSPENNRYSPDGYCISVLKKDFLVEASHDPPAPSSENPPVAEDLFYAPETEGMTLSGTVLKGQDRQPGDLLNLGMTLLGSDPDYIEFTTDEKGRFRIIVPGHQGSMDALISFAKKGDEPVEVFMDEEFSVEFFTLPPPAVDYLRDHPGQVEEVMMIRQLREAFAFNVSEGVGDGEPGPDLSFYGTPEYRYRTEDYVALPDLEEFFFEIIPQIRVEESDGEQHLVVLNDRGAVSEYPPLVLLDHVPVPEIEKMLSVPPRQIDHIDIVNTVYIRGNNLYGGIVSIITDQGNRAGVTLPRGSTFVSFTGYGDRPETVFPDYGEGIQNERIPDLRHTLYWAAQYEIPEGKEGSFGFYTSDLAGEFILLVRGITDDGTIIEGSCSFTVE